MLEENEILYDDQNTEQNVNDQKLINQRNFVNKNSRNIATNANAVRTAADVASKTAHPVAKAIGTGVKVADKLSGGKVSEKLGKQLNLANKLAPGGGLSQKLLNKTSESGMASRLGSVLSHRNSLNNPSKFLSSSNNNEEKVSNIEQTNQSDDSNEGEVSFENVKVSVDFIKKALIAMIPISCAMIFICLIVTSSQIFINSISLGQADSLSHENVDKKIKENEDNWSDEITDDHENLQTGYIPKSDVFLLNQSNEVRYVRIAERQYNEADLSELKDFYGNMIEYNEEEGLDMYTVYTFFFKLYDIYTYYSGEYNIDLDLPLIMATLNVQSTDRTLIFSSNTDGYVRIASDATDAQRKEEGRKKFDYTNYYDYKSTSTNSKYDIEVLAQNMVSLQATEKCVDSTGKEVNSNILKDEQIGTQVLVCNENETYSVTDATLKKDPEKYKEFLTEFLGNKYFLSEGETDLSKYEAGINGKKAQIYDAKEQYESLAGGYVEDEIEINTATSVYYWWPIGSEETIEVNGKVFANQTPATNWITSVYGFRNDPFGRGTMFHSGVDMSGNFSFGQANIIAVKSGIVVNVTTGCVSSVGLDSCGGSYGNHVIIQHSDGNYSLYAHLHENSIIVSEGEAVEQGQVIGKMGSSGNSTGVHLHFEIREGQNSYSATVDPLKYISIDNPRIVFTGDEFISWLNSWEGHSPIDGDYYVVENIGDGVRTVGGGVTLENNIEKFRQYGIDINDYPVGSKIAISIVDQIQYELISTKRDNIENILSNNSITLQENQIQALISQTYNIGNISGFPEAYNKYGNTQALYDNWFFRSVSKGTIFETGLTRRRNSEWSLFFKGEYVYNG